jgi:hypothetical protein
VVEELARLRNENTRLQARLAQAELVIDLAPRKRVGCNPMLGRKPFICGKRCY